MQSWPHRRLCCSWFTSGSVVSMCRRWGSHVAVGGRAKVSKSRSGWPGSHAMASQCALAPWSAEVFWM